MNQQRKWQDFWSCLYIIIIGGIEDIAVQLAISNQT